MLWFRRRSAHPAEDDLSAYLDGELGRRAAGVRSHLDTCAACQARLEALRSVQSLLAGLPRPAPSRSFILTPAQDNLATRPPARRPVFALAPALALSLLVALLTIDLAVLPDNASRPNREASRALQQPAAAESQSKAQDAAERSLPSSPAAAAPRPAGTTTGAGALSQADRPPAAATAPVTGFAEPAARESSPQPPATSDARNVVQVLEIAAAVVLVVSLLALLRERFLRKGEL